MPPIKMKTIDGIGRKGVSNAAAEFMRRCRLKNLSPRTLAYYDENLNWFQAQMPAIQFVDEITQEAIDAFICQELDRGNKVTAINSRLRGLFAFLHFCFDREWATPFRLSQMKEDETFKEPYTDAELQKLLKQPHTNNWVE